MAKRKDSAKNMGKKNVDDKVLDELAKSLKSIRNSDGDSELDEDLGEESELEEDVRHNINNFQFRNFVQQEDSAPALERIAGRQAGPVFVGGISRGPQTIPGEEKSSDPFKYMPGNNGNEEPKYLDSDSHLTAQVERVDFSKVGRNAEPWRVNQEVNFMQSQEAKFGTSSQEKMFGVERFDASREQRKNPMEREEAKYDKYKPDLPKSR